ncbi:hypothetical protein [uncultured Bacteroides sp.]|uniref:hypothetical protein n=1 Tax=uncultured Bacteroides sp. TaxID=162156 RepID=UPI002AAC1FF4|nr:hypothetical protein [uncultured Bacteroides sp.]
MKWIYISLCCLLSASCINNEKAGSLLFTDKLVNRWEKATIDTIINICERNKNTNADTFYLEQLSYYKTNLYSHKARLHFIEDLQHDTTFQNAKIENCIVIESQCESNMYNMIVYRSNNQNICLSYRLWHTTDVRNKSFMLYEKYTIDTKKLQRFIQEVRKSNLFKNESNNGEYYNGNIVVSFFSKDRVEVFPYLTFNFSNSLYRDYNEIFK